MYYQLTGTQIERLYDIYDFIENENIIDAYVNNNSLIIYYVGEEDIITKYEPHFEIFTDKEDFDKLKYILWGEE